MSSEYDLVVLFSLISKNLYEFIGPVLMILGTVSCILSLFVFGRKNLRKNPCSKYLIAVNVNNLFFIYTSILFSTLETGYSVNLSTFNVIICRFRSYTTLLFDVLTPCYLILASVDRILITSRNALTRQKSTSRLAYICIIIVTIFWLIVHSHSLIFMNIITFTPGLDFCYFQSSVYVALISYYTLIIKAILIPCLMIGLGLWAVKNVRAMVRVAPAVATTDRVTNTVGLYSVQSKDRQLIRILLIDTGIYSLFNIMLAGILIYEQVTQNQSKTFFEAQLETFMLGLGIFGTSMPFCIGCYTNVLVSKTFRQEVKNALMCK